MTLKEAHEFGIATLKDAGIETPAVDAGVLLCSAAGCDRTFLYVHSEHVIDPGSLKTYMSFLHMRSEGMPVQYITGRCGFMSLDFMVGPGVLVPRPETEILVETAVEMLRSFRRPAVVLDLGTGSGCIAVSIAHMLDNSRVFAADISEEALRISRLNAERNGVGDRLEFVRSNLFEGLAGLKFDAVISNPPYIRSMDIGSLQREVRDFEPHTALDGGSDGLDFYRRIAENAPSFLNQNGLLLFEVGQGQAVTVAELMGSSFTDIRVKKDLSGIDRVVTGEVKVI